MSLFSYVTRYGIRDGAGCDDADGYTRQPPSPVQPPGTHESAPDPKRNERVSTGPGVYNLILTLALLILAVDHLSVRKQLSTITDEKLRFDSYGDLQMAAGEGWRGKLVSGIASRPRQNPNQNGNAAISVRSTTVADQRENDRP